MQNQEKPNMNLKIRAKKRKITLKNLRFVNLKNLIKLQRKWLEVLDFF